MTQDDLKMNKSVLWAYKNKLLGFTSHRKKREMKIKKEIKRGIRDVNQEDPFELFISLQNIRYVYYKETDKILGNTFGMCILQDFEAVTPNILARCVETVEGGGLVVLLLKSMNSLKQLYTMTMDVHSRYRTAAHQDVVARFNERFILSLGSCETCLVIDDELNVLPISGGKKVTRLPPPNPDEEEAKEHVTQLKSIKEGLKDVSPAGPLVDLARTADQAKALLKFFDVISEKTLRSTVTLTASRGRGKSAALGIAISAAIAHGYSNIFVTSPSPENLRTLFEFIFKGFDALQYEEHQDYDITQSIHPDFHKAIVRVDIHRDHRQTIQYIKPTDSHVLGQAELLIIDEAAAIPLPVVKKLFGPYVVFMASTVHGYEGTGRSLSLKLIQQLREQSSGKSISNNDGKIISRTKSNHFKEADLNNRYLSELTLEEPIRYAPGDSVEKWLNSLLCLDATVSKRITSTGLPHPSKCTLFNVNRDTLFSYHPVSENFLHKMMALYVSSHYKNSPNDLQLMSDAPAHQLYVLLPPVDVDSKRIPDPLVVIQVALEGEIAKKTVANSLGRGERPAGDMIPWTLSSEFNDAEFGELSGARIVRIATNPNYTGMGYGSKALELLQDYFEGKFTNIEETGTATDLEPSLPRVTDAELEQATLTTDDLSYRDPKSLPPLLMKLSEKPPHYLHYLGVSFGLTPSLNEFWKKDGFAPVYLKLAAADITGEHSCIMLKVLAGRRSEWLAEYANTFYLKFMFYLGYDFKKYTAVQALNVFQAVKQAPGFQTRIVPKLTKTELDIFSPHLLKGLDIYIKNGMDYNRILFMLPRFGEWYFLGKLPEISLSGVQSAILLAMSIQKKTMDETAKELNLSFKQTEAIFAKVAKKFNDAFRDMVIEDISESLPQVQDKAVAELNGEELTDDKFQPVEQSLTDELDEGSKETNASLREKQAALREDLSKDLQKYAIPDDIEWKAIEKSLTKSAEKNGIISIKNAEKTSKRKVEKASDIYEEEMKSLKKPKKKSSKHGKKK